MPLSDLECPVCYQHYCRQDRVPRRLNCCHAFCTPCLEHLEQWKDTICTLRCPLCRWTTCLPPLQSPEEALWVDTDLWECISDFEKKEEEEGGAEEEEPLSECVASKHSRHQRNIPNMLHKLSVCIWPRNKTPIVYREPLFKIFKNLQPFVRKSSSTACSSSAACQQD